MPKELPGTVLVVSVLKETFSGKRKAVVGEVNQSFKRADIGTSQTDVS